MTSRRSLPVRPDVVSLTTQDENDRLAMVIMQLEMALALAGENGFDDVEASLQAALDEARRLHSTLLN